MFSECFFIHPFNSPFSLFAPLLIGDTNLGNGSRRMADSQVQTNEEAQLVKRRAACDECRKLETLLPSKPLRFGLTSQLQERRNSSVPANSQRARDVSKRTSPAYTPRRSRWEGRRRDRERMMRTPMRIKAAATTPHRMVQGT